MVGPWFRTKNDQQHSHATGLVPLFVSADNPQRRLLVTPLFVYHRNYEAKPSHVVSPLYFQSSRPEGSTHVLFPLWWQGRQGSKSHAMLMPLYWHSPTAKNRRHSTWRGRCCGLAALAKPPAVLLPLFWYSRDRANQTGSEAVLPLFYERHSRTSQTFATALFGFGKAPDKPVVVHGPISSGATTGKPASALSSRSGSRIATRSPRPQHR